MSRLHGEERKTDDLIVRIHPCDCESDRETFARLRPIASGEEERTRHPEIRDRIREQVTVFHVRDIEREVDHERETAALPQLAHLFIQIAAVHTEMTVTTALLRETLQEVVITVNPDPKGQDTDFIAAERFPDPVADLPLLLHGTVRQKENRTNVVFSNPRDSVCVCVITTGERKGNEGMSGHWLDGENGKGWMQTPFDRPIPVIGEHPDRHVQGCCHVRPTTAKNKQRNKKKLQRNQKKKTNERHTKETDCRWDD